MTVPILFNRRLVRLHRDMAARKTNNVAEIVQATTCRLLDRLDDINRTFNNALEIGGRGIVSKYLQQHNIPTISGDLSSYMAALNTGSCICIDEESLPFKENSFDLIIANFTLHWVNDLPGALIQLRKILKPDGLFLASIPIVPTLSVLRNVLAEVEVELTGKLSPRISPFPDLRACATLMQRAGFALPVIDKEEIMISYRSSMALIEDLRAAGEGNALVERAKYIPPRILFGACFERLKAIEPLEIPFTFAILTGWAPDSSQAQPLKPGQFSISLEDAFAKNKLASNPKESNSKDDL